MMLDPDAVFAVELRPGVPVLSIGCSNELVIGRLDFFAGVS
jgi:hypothetical protein